jgi:hypothetical protein
MGNKSDHRSDIEGGILPYLEARSAQKRSEIS